MGGDIIDSGAGNDYFQRRLRDYTRLGPGYDLLWKSGYYKSLRQSPVKVTEQGLIHSKNVECNVYRLLQKVIEQLPNEFLYTMVVSCILHDCGKNKNPRRHGIQSAVLIRSHAAAWLQLSPSLCDVVAHIAEYHVSGRFDKPVEMMPVGGNVDVYVPSAAAIFKLADTMDTTESRAFPLYASLGKRTRKADFLNKIRSKMPGYTIRKRSIQIQVPEPGRESDHEDVFAYVAALNAETTLHQREVLRHTQIVVSGQDSSARSIPISIPCKFAVMWMPVAGMEPARARIVRRLLNVSKGSDIQPRQLAVPCRFFADTTDVDIKRGLLSGISERSSVDTKYLYWSVDGTERYLQVTRDPGYDLPGKALGALDRLFATRIFPAALECNSSIRHIIDLGPGDGVEVVPMLKAMRSQVKGQVWCTLVDFSLPILRQACLNLCSHGVESILRDRCDLQVVNCDFLDPPRCGDILAVDGPDGCRSGRLFALLGGTFGNMAEDVALRALARVMRKDDLLLVGVDVLRDKDKHYVEEYATEAHQDFLLTPLEVLDWEEANNPDLEFRCRMESDRSKVNRARTLRSTYEGDLFGEILVGYSTKYDVGSLSQYIELGREFQLVSCPTDKEDPYALLLLKRR